MSDALVQRHGRVGFLHAIVVGAAVLTFLFILCWAGEAVGFVPATHRFVAIFAGDGETRSPYALVQGLPSALAFGALGGAALAFFSNLFRFLDR